MPNKRWKKANTKDDNEEAQKECVFCGHATDDEEMYGKKMSKGGITVHYFCMLFSSALAQSGKTDDDGLLGFLVKDIHREVNRGKRLKCTFCKKAGATIGCSNSMCRHKYHYYCGLQNETLYQFFGSYSSFCEEHRPRQPPPQRERLGFKGVAKTCCSICMSAVTARASTNTLRSPCCKNSWFHRKCIQAMANSSGLHFFKCPLCNNKERFQEEMLTYGIYIPDQDAAWEREPNAFEDLLERPSTCEAENCLCDQGREHNLMGSQWELMTCDMCGSKATHLKCGNLTTPLDDWACVECTQVVGKYRSKSKKTEKVFPDNFLEDKFRRVSKSPCSKKASVKRKYSEKTDREHNNSISSPQLQMKKKRRKLLATGQEHANSKNDKSNNCPSTSPLCQAKNKLKNKGNSKPNSRVQVNLSTESLASLDKLRGKLFTNKKTKELRLKYKNKMKKATTIQNLSINTTKLYKSKSNGKKEVAKSKTYSKLKSVKNNNKDDNKPKSRETNRSKLAAEAAIEIQRSDVANLPKWLKNMYEEDIITGKNLGDKFVQDSPVLCMVDSPHGKDGSPFIRETKTAHAASDPVSPDTELNYSNREFKQLMMTDFISGKNLGRQFATQSPKKLHASKLNNKLKLSTFFIKSKKMTGQDAGTSSSCDESTPVAKNKSGSGKNVNHYRRFSNSPDNSLQSSLLLHWLKSPETRKEDQENKTKADQDEENSPIQKTIVNDKLEINDLPRSVMSRSPLFPLSSNGLKNAGSLKGRKKVQTGKNSNKTFSLNVEGIPSEDEFTNFNGNRSPIKKVQNECSSYKLKSFRAKRKATKSSSSSLDDVSSPPPKKKKVPTATLR